MLSSQHPSRRDLLRWAGTAGALTLSAGCGGGGSAGAAPANGEEPIAGSLDQLTPQNAPATFRNTDRLAATRSFGRAGSVAPLAAHSRSLRTLSYAYGGQTRTVQDLMDRTRNAGLLILKNGAIALESYGLGNTAQSRWTSFSIGKSLTSTLYGAALQAGALANLEITVDAVLPSFANTAWAGTTVRQLLRMSSGVRWLEDYLSATSDIATMSNAIKLQQPGVLLEHVRTRPRVATPGTRWSYSSGETHVLGAVLAKVTGRHLSDLVTDWIWSRAGMEADGYWLLDGPDGLELASANFSATLRDYGRLGLFVLREGQVGAQRMLPAGWRDLAGRPDTPLTQPGAIVRVNGLGYGYQWWALPNSSAFTAQGIFGQFLYIDPLEDLVAVIWSAWPGTWDDAAEAELYTMLAAAAQALR